MVTLCSQFVHSCLNLLSQHFEQEQAIRTVVPLAMFAFNHLLRNMSRASASEVAWTCAGGPTHSYGVLSTCARGAQGERVDIICIPVIVIVVSTFNVC